MDVLEKYNITDEDEDKFSPNLLDLLNKKKQELCKY